MTVPDALVLRPLISRLRSGSSARGALSRWPDALDPNDAALAKRCAAGATLGAPLGPCIESARGLLGDATDLVRLSFQLHLSVGVDLAALLEEVERMQSQNRSRAEEARAHAAGMQTSARVVAVLPAASLPLGSGVDLFTTPILACVAVGLGLALAGFHWLRRLSPSPDLSPGAPWFLRIVAACLGAGMELPSVLAALAPHHAALGRAAAQVRWGCTWVEALLDSEEDEVRQLGRLVHATRDSGVPLVAMIESEAESREAMAAAVFEERVRKATVKMALPLVLCVLPSFVALGLFPTLISG